MINILFPSFSIAGTRLSDGWWAAAVRHVAAAAIHAAMVTIISMYQCYRLVLDRSWWHTYTGGADKICTLHVMHAVAVTSESRD